MERETDSPAAFMGLGASTVGEATLPRTAPATAFVTLAARDLPRMNEPKKLERGEVAPWTLLGRSVRRPPRFEGEEGGSALVPRPAANMLAAGIAMAAGVFAGAGAGAWKCR